MAVASMSSRQSMMDGYAKEIANHIRKNGSANLVYVCTHNSRRSQFAQLWSAHHSEMLKLPITSYSAGTEKTACHPNVLEVLRNEGFGIESDVDNHRVVWNGNTLTTLGSKTIDSGDLPNEFFAIMTCSDADENCPFIPSALGRFRLTFEDPKWSDKTNDAIKVYQETSLTISNDIKYLLQQIKQQL